MQIVFCTHVTATLSHGFPCLPSAAGLIIHLGDIVIKQDHVRFIFLSTIHTTSHATKATAYSTHLIFW